jgi:hypothetical protein
MSLDDYKISKENLPECLKQGISKAFPSGNSKGWEVYRSNISLCLYVKLPSGEKSPALEIIKDLIRDHALDIGDWSSYNNHSLPLICVIQCSNGEWRQWRQISGDQEWLRGQLSLQIVDSEQDAKQRLDLLLNDTFTDIPDVQPMNDKALAKKLTDVANDEKRKLSSEQRELLKVITQGLDSSYAQSFLDPWESGLLVNYKGILGGENV